jgi:hypothetical protein
MRAFRERLKVFTIIVRRSGIFFSEVVLTILTHELKFILREQFFPTAVEYFCTRSSSATVSSNFECVQGGCPLLMTVLSAEGVASFLLVHLRNLQPPDSDADDEIQSFYWHRTVLCTFAPKVEM